MSSATTTLRRRAPEMPPLLGAKLNRPQTGPLILDRPRLAHALEENANRPLTLVMADAGYGKTTLLASFARVLARPVVWYALMPSDADLIVFSRYLAEGFRREAPRFGTTFRRAIEESRPGARTAEMLAGTLAHELASLRGKPYLLVLDDFHEVASNAQVVAFTDTLLRNLPANVRILIASRTVPPLALERMRARGDVFELNSSQLRLTRAELERLFTDVYGRPLEGEQVAALEEATLGWPTAVHLVHEALRRREDRGIEDVIAEFRASNLELHDYLSSEVYARLEPDARRLLERTAALTRFDTALASALSGIARPHAVLDGLERRGLLRTFGSGTHASFECHDLVQRFVRQELEAREGADALRALEGDTADALAGRGEPERALRHYLAAERVPDATRIVTELAPLLLQQGRAPALIEYLADLPPEVLRDHLALAVARADAMQAVGAWDEAEAIYLECLERARRQGERALECRTLLGYSKLLNLRGKHEQVLGMAERGLAQARGLEVEIRARLLQAKAGAHFYLGQYQAAVQVLDQVREMLRSHANLELVVPTIHNLAMAYAAQGRLREAAVELRAALAHVRGTTSPRAALYLSNLALLLSDQWELADARRAAEEGLAAAQRFSNRALETTCQEALAQILSQSGDLDGALAALRRVEELNAELRIEVVAADVLALRGRIFCWRGEYRRAVEFLNEALARCAARPDDPRIVDYRATLAWCELRGGRVRVARELLQSLVGRADGGENELQRMRVHYWLAEAKIALGERGAEAHLAMALGLVRERGYSWFLRVQAREEPRPLLHALAHDIEPEVVSAALVEAGAAVEERVLEILGDAPARVGEAAVTVLAEIGGPVSRERLERLAAGKSALRPAIRTALRLITDRIARGTAPPEAESGRRARLLLFGPPRLTTDDRPVPPSAWRAQRAFHVLIYLALHPRGASRDVLLERFWPGRQLAAGKRNFHPTLSYVRKVLPPSSEAPILREGEFYRLNPAYPLSCDAWELEAALTEARSARDPEERRAVLRRAASIVTGPYLEGLYADWADELQARMRDRTEKLLLDLGMECARAGAFEEALEHFKRAAEIDPYRETTRLAAIECLIRVGNRRAALVEYDRLKGLLRAELEVEPLPETEEAMQQLLAGRSVHDWPGKPVGTEVVAAQDDAATGQAGIKEPGRRFAP